MSIKIKIDADIWTPLAVKDQEKITEILRSSKLLDQSDSIEASDAPVVADAQSVVADSQGFIDNFWDKQKRNLCRAGCDVAGASAAAACTAGTAGVALAACLAAATVAQQACRDAC